MKKSLADLLGKLGTYWREKWKEKKSMSKVHNNPVSVKNNQAQSLKENSQTRKLPAKIYKEFIKFEQKISVEKYHWNLSVSSQNYK